MIENRGRQPRKLVWTLELLGEKEVLSTRSYESYATLGLLCRRSEETKKKDRKTPTKDKPAEEGGTLPFGKAVLLHFTMFNRFLV